MSSPPSLSMHNAHVQFMFFLANIKEKRFLLPTFDPQLQRSNMASLSTPRQHPTLCFRYAQSGLVPLVLKTYLSNEMTNICNPLQFLRILKRRSKFKKPFSFQLSFPDGSHSRAQQAALLCSAPKFLCIALSAQCATCATCAVCSGLHSGENGWGRGSHSWAYETSMFRGSADWPVLGNRFNLK